MTTMGRTVLTDEVQVKLCELVAAGEFVHVACGLVGVSDDSVAYWLKRAAAVKAAEDVPDTEGLSAERCTAFAQAFLRAKAAGAAVYIANIRRKSEGSDRSSNPADWKADAWILERLQPRVFGPAANKIELTGADAGPVKVASVVVMPPLDPDDDGAE
jgi:hypothetical protein